MAIESDNMSKEKYPVGKITPNSLTGSQGLCFEHSHVFGCTYFQCLLVSFFPRLHGKQFESQS